MKFSYYIFALYLIVYPFYFFESGDPQIADLLGVLLIAINIKDILLQIKTNAFTKGLYLFVIYTLILNSIWMLILGDIFILKNSLFYLYSFFMLLIFYSKIKDPSFLSIIIKGISICLIIQLILWPLIADQGVRTHMFFKNPNQLAFWSFCILLISHIICVLIKPKRFYVFTTLVLSTLFIFISASKSAIFASILFWIYYLIKSRKQLFMLISIVIVGFSFLIVLEKFNVNNFTTVTNVIERLTEKKTAGQLKLEGRGYERILNYPEYLLFGAGEGEYTRFGEQIELHSTFFNILFSYGIIGLSFFLIAIRAIIKKASKQVVFLLILLVLYTLAHMTLRSPLFWLSLLLMYELKEYNFITNNLNTSND